MPNLNYAEVWSPELLQILIQETLSSPFVTQNVKWLNAKAFHFTQMSTGGYKAHDRKGGWNRGEYNQTDKVFELTHDRDIEFLVDKADVDETNATASIQNISRIFEQTQVAPENDALFFSKTAAVAQGLDGYHSATALSAYTAANVFEKLKGFLAAGKLRRYKAQGALVMYVSSPIMDLLERSDKFQRKIEMTAVANGGMGLETRITDAHKINVLIATPLTTKMVPKINSIYYFAPGAHTLGDGYLYQNRSLSDVFTFPNGRDGKVDSVYVDVDTTEYTGA